MITEDYVSFETAKLLKEKGFDEPCHCFYEYKKRLYNDMDKYFPNGMKNSDHDKEGNKGISAPTISLAMKWLREVHKIFIAINIIPHTTVTMEQRYYFFKLFKDRRPYNFPVNYLVKCYTTYEEACEASIKYCLKHLI